MPFGADTALGQVKPSVKPHPKALGCSRSPDGCRREKSSPKQLGLAAPLQPPLGLPQPSGPPAAFRKPSGSESH